MALDRSASLDPRARSHALPARIAGTLAVAVAALGATSAGAAPAEWSCWLHRGQQIACMSLAEGSGTPVQAARSSPRELMRAIRESPGALRGQTIYIPMFTVPFHDSRMAELASAVLCGPRPRHPCSVTFDTDASHMSPQARQALSDANDPLLNR